MQTLNKTLRGAGDNEILFQEVLASFPQVYTKVTKAKNST
jgi:hypothetical protein